MSDIHAGLLAATRQSWKKRSARDILVETMEANKGAGEGTLFKKFVQQIKSDDEDLEVVAEYAFINTYRAFIGEAKYQATAAIRQKIHKTLVSSIKEQVLILNWEMPNGKKLRHCTGRECVVFGGWLRTVGNAVGSRKVGEVLNEQELRSLVGC